VNAQPERECPHENCFAPHTACILGNVPCEHLAEPAGEADDEEVASALALPWSGLPLGSADLPAVVGTARSRLVAIVGAPKAGKTTALAAHWIADRRGGGEHGAAFAGSHTLLGWQQIARHLQWVPYGSGGFPLHTSANGERAPALLHETLRSTDGFVHLLYTDVPGEWYRAWAYDEAAAPGAQWIAERADVFVVLADSAALAGEERGRARGDYEALAARVAAVAGGRPVIPVRAKADLDMPDRMREYVEERNRVLFGAETVAVSVHERAHAPITAAVDLAVTAALAARPVVLTATARGPDSLLAFRSPAGEGTSR